MRVQGNLAVRREGLVVLRDLVAGGLILIEVVLAVETALGLYLALEGYGGAEGR